MSRGALFTLVRALPRRLVSRLAGRLARVPVPGPLRRPLFGLFARASGADLAEAGRPLRGYRTFQDLFTRSLRAGARPAPREARAVASPADGTVRASGPLGAGTPVRAKGVSYGLADLLGDPGRARTLERATHLVVHLAPGDYHRLHWPLSGHLDLVRHLPGDLWPVHPEASSRIPRLLCRNERVAVFGRAENGGPFALVLVGALNVGSIRLAVHPLRTNGDGPARARAFRLDGLPVRRGEELGRFELGSTVVLLLSAAAGDLSPLAAGTPLRVGAAVGRLRGPAPFREAPPPPRGSRAP